MSAKLEKLREDIECEEFGASDQFWIGADVAIVEEEPELGPPGFYPDPLFVVSPHAAELSWLFTQVRDCFIDHQSYGIAKEELFGEMAVRANDVIATQPDIDARALLLAVLDSADLAAVLFEADDQAQR
jgi:hypothetical protein